MAGRTCMRHAPCAELPMAIPSPVVASLPHCSQFSLRARSNQWVLKSILRQSIPSTPVKDGAESSGRTDSRCRLPQLHARSGLWARRGLSWAILIFWCLCTQNSSQSATYSRLSYESPYGISVSKYSDECAEDRGCRKGLIDTPLLPPYTSCG